MLLQRTDYFYKSSRATNSITSGSFHLCRQRSLCTDKFIERKSRHLNNTVVKHWLETCISFLCNCILDLVQCISKGNLCSNFCDRVSCRFGSQCRRTAYTRVYQLHNIQESGCNAYCTLHPPVIFSSVMIFQCQYASDILYLQESGKVQQRYCHRYELRPDQYFPYYIQ